MHRCKKNSKKSQITVFIILGLIILAGASFFIYQRSKITTKETEVAEILETKIETLSIKTFVEECLEKTGRMAIAINSIQGGYFETPDPYFEYGFYKIPFYYLDGEFKNPTKEIIETELSKGIEKSIFDCINLSHFTPYTINFGNATVKTTIVNETTLFNLDFPVIIKKDNSETTISEFFVAIPSEINKALIISKEVVEQHDEKNGIPLGFITDLGYEEGVLFNVINMRTEVLYTIEFNSSVLKDQTYTFTFGVKYQLD
ncbi:hypothetical protein ACFL0W_03280 [Nanoarchaeota archaeon]